MFANKKSKLLTIVLAVIVVGAISFYVVKEKRSSVKPGPEGITEQQSTDQVAKSPPTKRPGVEFDSYPEDFPKDLQVIPAFFDQSLIIKTPEGKEIVSITYTTQNPQNSMVDLFKTFLTRSEWQIHSQTLPDKSQQLSVTKGAQRADITVKSLDKNFSQVFLLYYR